MRISNQISAVLIISMGILLLFTITCYFYSIKNFKNEEIANIRKTLLEERKNQLRDVVQNAYSVLETANFYEPAQAAISSMRFGKDHQNYFFVIDRKGMFWVNAAHHELVGNVYLDLTDINGKRYVEEIINASRGNEDGFIRYQVFRSDDTKPSTKLVHFKRFDKWDWIVCAGIFIDDIEVLMEIREAQLHSALINQIRFFIFAELLALLISVFISKRIFRSKLVHPIEQLTEAAEEMVVGNFDNDIDIKSSCEINKLVDAMQRMQDSFTIASERLKVISRKPCPIKFVGEESHAPQKFESSHRNSHLIYRSAS